MWAIEWVKVENGGPRAAKNEVVCVTVLRSEENEKNRGGLKKLQEALGDP